MRLAILVFSIGLADSLNPSTVGPALYLATRAHPGRQVAEFALGVLIVNLAGGLLIALGPGQLLLSLVPRPDPTAKHLIEAVVGAAIIALAALLWLGRGRLRRRGPARSARVEGAGLPLGAAIAAIELPTALPYFAAIAAIVGSGGGVAEQVGLLVLFNVAFVLPVIAILCALLVAGDGADRLLAPAGEWLDRHWPVLLAGLGSLVGAAFLGVGVAGLVSP